MSNSDLFFSEFPWWLSYTMFRFHFPFLYFSGGATTLCRTMRSLWCCINCPVLYPPTTCAPKFASNGRLIWINTTQVSSSRTQLFLCKWLCKPIQISAKMGFHFKAEKSMESWQDGEDPDWKKTEKKTILIRVIWGMVKNHGKFVPLSNGRTPLLISENY